MTLEFKDSNDGHRIKQWPNWSGEIPQAGDFVLIHWGDYHEEEEVYKVKWRVISGTEPNKVICVVRKNG